MKSLLVSQLYFPPQVGGISRMLERIARELGRERVCCLTGVPRGATRVDPPRRGYPRVYRSPASFSGGTKAARALAWGGTVSRIMVQERPKAVLLGTIWDGVWGDWLRQWLRLPTMAFAFGNDILGVLEHRSGSSHAANAAKTMLSSDRIVAESRYTAGLVERVGVSPDRIEVVYPGCDATEFSPRTPDPELRRRVLGARYQDRVILTIGNLVARKGHDMVIRALPRILETVPNLTYLIVGEGPYRRELERLAGAMGIRDRVVFAGRIEDGELPAYYALCEGFVMVSRDRSEDCDVEGFGIVYLEANACGKAVVGGRSGGVPEAVIEGETGLLADPEDPADIANALLRILTDCAQAARMGEQGRARVVRDFGWNQVADRVHAIVTHAALDRKARMWSTPS